MADLTTREQLENVWVSFAEHGGTDKDTLDIIEASINELTEYEFIFEMQWNLTREATEYWQKKTGKNDTWPDLMQMMMFLMNEVHKQTPTEGE